MNETISVSEMFINIFKYSAVCVSYSNHRPNSMSMILMQKYLFVYQYRLQFK